MKKIRWTMLTGFILILILCFIFFLNHMPQKNTDWAKGLVWYQVFPERFNNGDSSNDPIKDYVMSEHSGFESKEWQISEWTSEWYRLTPKELSTGEDFDYNVIRRRYGGDLQGIIDKLDYLKELGVGAIYLNPIFEAPSMHKYDSTYYHHVDPYFGPDPEGDIKLIESEDPGNSSTWVWTKADLLAVKLIEEVHKRDMKIIFDGVFNHVGIHNFAFEDLIVNGQNSKYADWFDVYEWNKTNSIGIPFTYAGWANIPYLPEWREDEFGLVDGPKKYVFDSVNRWMDPNSDGRFEDGVDGWRLDVAFSVKHSFWKKFRSYVKNINPSAYLVAEVWGTPEQESYYLQGNEFDAVMNYNFAFSVYDFFINEEKGVNASKFVFDLEHLLETIGNDSVNLQQNLLDSHDSQRILSGIINKNIGEFRNNGEFFSLSKASNPLYNVSGPNDLDLKKLKIIVAFQMLFTGAPMVYYGDEAGMWGANDPDSRKPMVWEELNYSPEQTLPNQSSFERSDVYFRTDLFDYYKFLINFRNNSSAVSIGEFKFIYVNDEHRTFGFKRQYKDESVFVFINAGENNMTFDYVDEDVLNNQVYDILTNTSYVFEKGDISLNLESNSVLILSSN
ncbi:alpha-amylase [Candidatus Woesearchaeota archaeon CG10_big_fil_rev_8_21_14_0_10_32_9]|nr:MAG: alpha-amylase [Candidatus Woesearchaeota archaeon CG10_big_fil_rev_8_21_14_0_10_32_9]